MDKSTGVNPEALPAMAAVAEASRVNASAAGGLSNSRAVLQLGCLILAYVGVYLCRKNFAVAVPLLQTAFGTDKAHVGAIESYATVSYALGKLFWGPNVVDRFGGRVCLFLLLGGVALFSGMSAFAVTLPMFGFCYAANRFFGSGGWESMIKLVPDWFPARHLALALAFLSLSFVFGGVCALLLAGQVAAFSGNNWRAVMGFPSLVLLVIIGLSWLVLSRERKLPEAAALRKSEWSWRRILEIAYIPQFWIVCGLSFILTMTRETFNVWTVDFLKTDGGGHLSTPLAALLSTPFDAMGAAGILLLGWIMGLLSPARRNWLLFAILVGVAGLIFFLPALARLHLWMAVTAIGLIGFLSYGPYSLLAGVLALEIRGKDWVATVAGLVDASGYLAGIASGYCFGRILDHGGDTLGFHALGLVTLLAALLCLGLSHPGRDSKSWGPSK